MKRPLILVTNDDDITAGGIKALIGIAKEFGDVLVVAPDRPQSAQGHAITISHPIFLRKSDLHPGAEAYECSGTPVDCVKLARSVIMKGRKADLCLSGINHGSNAAINILYSGTMSAAMEASLEGIPSIGFSFLDYRADADFSVCLPYVRHLIDYVLKNGMETGNLFNVNIPNLPAEEIKGIKVCRQADARWVEEYERKEDPRGREYYWLTGRFVNEDPRPDTDARALEMGYVSLVPSDHDLTHLPALEKWKSVEKDLQPAGLEHKQMGGPSREQELEQF
jgi:5'-nucleotidase